MACSKIIIYSRKEFFVHVNEIDQLGNTPLMLAVKMMKKDAI